MYRLSFSGSFPPLEGAGTYLALAMSLGTLLIWPWSLPSQAALINLGLAAVAAFVASRLRPVSAIGRMLNAIFRVKMPELDPPEQKIESWGYGIGRRFVWLSDIIRKAFTGPVSRDVAYIAVSLAAIALGVVLC